MSLRIERRLAIQCFPFGKSLVVVSKTYAQVMARGPAYIFLYQSRYFDLCLYDFIIFPPFLDVLCYCTQVYSPDIPRTEEPIHP